MALIIKSDENIRNFVIDFLHKEKTLNPHYQVVDVGGAKNTWCDEYVNAYVDIKPVETSKKVFIGDINDDLVWEEVHKFHFDFSICTHTLEDIRRPDFVIDKLFTVSKAGFIAVPNKHTELSCIESIYWIGYSHHRWIFTLLTNDTLCMVAKMPVTNYFIKSNWFAHLLGKIKLIDQIQCRLNRKPGGPGIEWIKKTKVSGKYELGFIWTEGFDYRFINNDYAGDNIYEAAQLYREQLEEGL